MKRPLFPILLAALPVLFVASPVKAAGFWDWVHHPVVYTRDYFRWGDDKMTPDPENGTLAQTHQWDNTHWTPDHWIQQDKDGLTLVKRFYTADIIRRQYVHDQTKILVVGPNFYELGGQDKRRVLATVDTVWKVTSGTPNGMFLLYDWDSKKQIGQYTKDGLQLQ